jgi:serine/threonine-protein kinase HipA
MEKKFRKAIILCKDKKAGILEETKDGYRFTYDDEFLKGNQPISLSLPLTQKVYESSNLFSFFLGLLPEGWYLNIVCKKLKIDKRDKFELLLSTCKNTIGAVTVMEIDNNE